MMIFQPSMILYIIHHRPCKAIRKNRVFGNKAADHFEYRQQVRAWLAGHSQTDYAGDNKQKG